ncbi:RNA polymerase sigma-70 factor, ECF subfamily [Pedobacter sp. ok626]|uniref:RNA polymerase sigma factor n=1 Tax=Pedobacter sp. ok626 TaxID=1761882 RepID=UPI00088473D4|nr:RNA polymerase sigma-70 factor [Pedobacter sp. ok626]SDL10242.1 RNA polymerase sigma-70 factor, ECF subfamily [Pedobacter sp. ok626]
MSKSLSQKTDNNVVLLDMSERETFNRLFRTHHAPLCYYAERITNSRDNAEDAVGEVFLKCWSKATQFDNEDHARFFLYRAVKNASMNKLRTDLRVANKHNMVSPDAEDTEESHLDRLVRSEVLREIYQEIDALPPQEKKVILLSLEDGKKLKDIADELNLSLQTVKNCRSRAVARLRFKLTADNFMLLNALVYLFVEKK